MPQGKQFIRRKEMAALLGVSERTIGNLMARRVIPFYRLSRGVVVFDIQQVVSALERYRVRAIGEEV